VIATNLMAECEIEFKYQQTAKSKLRTCAET